MNDQKQHMDVEIEMLQSIIKACQKGHKPAQQTVSLICAFIARIGDVPKEESEKFKNSADFIIYVCEKWANELKQQKP